MAITLKKSLEEIGAMPRTSINKFRRFYKRHPFGPLADRLNAYLCGSQARTVYSKKGGIKPIDFIKMFDGIGLTKQDRKEKAKRARRKPLPKTRITPQRMKAMVMAAGCEVIDLRKKEGGTTDQQDNR